VTDQDLAGTRIDPVFRQKMLTGSENADRSGYMREVARQPLAAEFAEKRRKAVYNDLCCNVQLAAISCKS